MAERKDGARTVAENLRTPENAPRVSEIMSEPLFSGSASLDAQKQRRKKTSGNWRLSLLATPRHARPKYQMPPEVFNSGVSPDALKAPPNERMDHMARPNLRSLYINKRSFGGNPNTFRDYDARMERRIDMAWNSIYNEYNKVRRDRRLKQQSGEQRRRRSRSARRTKEKKEVALEKKEKEAPKKGKGAKAEKGKPGEKVKKAKRDEDTVSERSEDLERHLQEWVSKRAQPKKVFEPEPIQRGPIADLEDLKERLYGLAMARHPREIYTLPAAPKHSVKEGALKYNATERMLELAKLPAHRVQKEEPIVLGSVSPAALLYKVTDRTAKLATPRARASATDADLKEAPFTIPKNALKYKATPRIIELAKPLVRK